MILRQCKYSVILRNKTVFLIIYPIFSAYQQSYSKKYFANELTLSTPVRDKILFIKSW